jgi:hypothetical protein
MDDLISVNRTTAMHPKSLPSSNRAFLGLAIMSIIIAMMLYNSLGI